MNISNTSHKPSCTSYARHECPCLFTAEIAQNKERETTAACAIRRMTQTPSYKHHILSSSHSRFRPPPCTSYARIIRESADACIHTSLRICMAIYFLQRYARTSTKFQCGADSILPRMLLGAMGNPFTSSCYQLEQLCITITALFHGSRAFQRFVTRHKRQHTMHVLLSACVCACTVFARPFRNLPP